MHTEFRGCTAMEIKMRRELFKLMNQLQILVDFSLIKVLQLRQSAEQTLLKSLHFLQKSNTLALTAAAERAELRTSPFRLSQLLKRSQKKPKTCQDNNFTLPL